MLLLFLILKASCTEVDLIELNTYGPYKQVQVIAWEWNPCYRRHDVVAWRYCTEFDTPRKVGRYWYVDLCGKTVRATKLIETNTNHDPERLNLRLHPEEMRRKL